MQTHTVDTHTVDTQITRSRTPRTTNHSMPLPQETLYRCLLLCVSCCVVFSVLLPIGHANVFAMLGVQGASLEHVCQHSRRKQDEQMQPAKRQHHGKCDLDVSTMENAISTACAP